LVVRETTVVGALATTDVVVRRAAVVRVVTTVVAGTGMSGGVALDRTWWTAGPRLHPAISTRPNAPTTTATGSPFRTRVIVAAGLTEVEYPGPSVPDSEETRVEVSRVVWIMRR
jgi:hypothetical protein